MKKDFDGFRKLMFSKIMEIESFDGESLENIISDFKVMIIEAVSAVGDYLQYYMDRHISNASLVSLLVEDGVLDSFILKYFNIQVEDEEVGIEQTTLNEIREQLIGIIDGSTGNVITESALYTSLLKSVGITNLKIGTSFRSLIEALVVFFYYLDYYVATFKEEFEGKELGINYKTVGYITAFPFIENRAEIETLFLSKADTDSLVIESGKTINVNSEPYVLLEDIMFDGRDSYKESVIGYTPTEVLTKRKFNFSRGEAVLVYFSSRREILRINQIKSMVNYHVIEIEGLNNRKPLAIQKGVSAIKGAEKTISYLGKGRDYEFVNIGKALFYPLGFFNNRLLTVSKENYRYCPVLDKSVKSGWGTFYNEKGELEIIFKGLDGDEVVNITYIENPSSVENLQNMHEQIFTKVVGYSNTVTVDYKEILSGRKHSILFSGIAQGDNLGEYINLYYPMNFSIHGDRIDINYVDGKPMSMGELELLRDTFNSVIDYMSIKEVRWAM